MDACVLEKDSSNPPCPIHLSTHSLIYPSIHLPILSIYPSMYIPIHSSVHPSTYPPTHPSAYPSTYISTHLFIHPSTYPSTYLSSPPLPLLPSPPICPSGGPPQKTFLLPTLCWTLLRDSVLALWELSVWERKQKQTIPPLTPTQCINCVRKSWAEEAQGRSPQPSRASWKASQGRRAVRKHPFSLVLPSARTPELLLCARPSDGKVEQIPPALSSSEGAWVGVSMGSSAADQRVQHRTARGSR